MTRRPVKIALVLISVSAVLLLVFRLTTSSSITISVTNDIRHLDTIVLVDGKPADLIGADDGIGYATKVGPGNHTVVVRSGGYAELTTQISTILRTDKNIEVTLDPTPFESIQQELYPNENVIESQYFSNDTWGVFRLEGGGRSLSVARLNAKFGQWEIMDEGIDLDIEFLRENGAPDELFSYVENSSL